MDLEFSDLRIFLYKNRNSDVFDAPYNLYVDMTFIEKNGNQTRFNPENQELLFCACLYRYHKKRGMESLVEVPLPYEIDPNLCFIEFYDQLSQYFKYPYPDSNLLDDNFYDKLIEEIKKVLTHDSNRGWTRIYSSKIEGNVDTSKESRKIYLSIDNKDLHEFALRLLEKCDDFGFHYEFRINADDNYRRADNVVIFTSDEDFPKYIRAIEEIKLESQDMDFGNAYMLSYPYNEYIGVVTKEKSNTYGSLSEVICDEICCIRNRKTKDSKNFFTSFEPFFGEVKNFLMQRFDDTIQFCNQYQEGIDEVMCVRKSGTGYDKKYN